MVTAPLMMQGHVMDEGSLEYLKVLLFYSWDVSPLPHYPRSIFARSILGTARSSHSCDQNYFTSED